MNLSIAIALVNKSVRPVRVTYDPDLPKNNSTNRLFKTFDTTLTKDDYIIVPTHTRHGFTVVKVEEVDMIINFDGGEQWDWVVGKVDKASYDSIIEQEKIVLSRIGKAEENRKRDELAKALGLADVELTDLDVVKTNAQLAVSSPRGAPTGENVEEAPSVLLKPSKAPNRPRDYSDPFDDITPF